jgi:ribonuclease BN (tRNA processing enzyme)
MKMCRRQFVHLAAGAAALPALSRMTGAQTALPQSKTGTRLITLGTAAGPGPRAHQAQSSNLLTVNGSHYVIDAGDGVARRIAKAGIVVRDIGTIFITHHHDDHTAGLGTLMSVAWDNQRTSPINVYGPPPTEALVRAAVQYYGISAEIRIADGGRSIPIAQIFNGHDVGTGLIYQDTNIKVSAAENSHFLTSIKGQLPANTNRIPIALKRRTA